MNWRAGASLPLLVFALVACGAPVEETPPAEASEIHLLNLDPEVDYVGQETCRQCHFEQFSTSSKTGMGRAFYPMTPEEVVEDFTADNEFVIEASGLHYRMLEHDGRFYQRQFMLDSKGREVAVDVREMVYVIGSNRHSRSYVTLIDDKFFQNPACWYPEEQKWELCPGYEFKNDHFAREIGMGCIHCHNGVMRLVEGQRNLFEKPYPHGIGCERCHGPGELHVERWLEGDEAPTGAADPTIVHLRRLPAEERIEVCVQCHMGDARASERVIRWDREVSFYRPGKRITDIIVPFRYVNQTQWDFGLSAQVDRLIQSRCYTESRGKIECLTCHNPHVTVYHEDRPADHFRRACLSCHAVEDCVETEEARQTTEPAADDCIQCHMRKTEPDDQRFTEFTDHWIRRDIDLKERDHRQNFEIEPIYPDRFASLPRGEQAFYKARATSLLGRDAPMSRQSEMWTSAERFFEQSIEEGFDTVYSWFFLGKILLTQQRYRDAEQAFEKAHAHDPTHHDAAFALGQALVRRGDLDRALQILTEMLERDPEQAMTLAEVGRIVSTQGRHEEALGYYDRALELEPWTMSLHMNKGKILAAMGRFEEAARKAVDAVQLDPDNPKVWQFYEKAHEAAGDLEAAAEGRRLGERLAKIKRPEES